MSDWSDGAPRARWVALSRGCGIACPSCRSISGGVAGSTSTNVSSDHWSSRCCIHVEVAGVDALAELAVVVRGDDRLEPTELAEAIGDTQRLAVVALHRLFDPRDVGGQEAAAQPLHVAGVDAVAQGEVLTWLEALAQPVELPEVDELAHAAQIIGGQHAAQLVERAGDVIDGIERHGQGTSGLSRP